MGNANGQNFIINLLHEMLFVVAGIEASSVCAVHCRSGNYDESLCCLVCMRPQFIGYVILVHLV